MRKINKFLLLSALLGSQGQHLLYQKEKELHKCPLCGKEHYHNGGFCSPEHAREYKKQQREKKL